MSQNTEVALIALILFFIIAGVGIFWLRLAGPVNRLAERLGLRRRPRPSRRA
jgi:hypothetical protein